MAGYYLSSVFCVVMDRVEVDVHYNEKKRNEANICPSKKVLLYSTNILTSLFRESEKKATRGIYVFFILTISCRLLRPQFSIEKNVWFMEREILCDLRKC